MLTPVERQKIDHIAIRDAIDQVAQRAAENQAQRQRNSVCALCLRNSQTIHTEATMAMTLNSQRCIPPASLRKLNAAPVLCASTRSNTLST